MCMVDSALTVHMQCTGFTTGTLYIVYGLSDFMQLVDSALTAHMQHTGFTTGTLYFLFCVWTLRFYAASG